MSIHPSLNISDKDKKHRSVLKRSERLRSMMDKSKWKEGDPVFGLPKIKSVRIKIKKEKAEKPAEAAAATAEGAVPTEAAVTKDQAAAKAPAAAPKAQEKK